MKLLNKEELKKAEEVLRHYFPYSQQAYGYVCVLNRKQADPIDVLVDQWPDFSVLLIRPQRRERADLFKLISIYTKDETALKNVLTRTDVLDWKQYFRVDQRFEEVIKAVAVSRGLPMNKIYVCRVMKLQDPSNLTTKRLPLEISSLNESNMSLVCSTWKYNQGEFSESFIRNMIRNFPSLCVLDAEGQPVSWILTYPFSAMGMLYTMPEHRQKGYAKALVTIMAKKLHSEGYPVYCLIEEDNEPSHRLFTSLGFTADPLYKISGFTFNQA
ncbi:glycine N-acyltransferase-like protein 3 isoform 6-T13 [Clarias gariepinus]|uniref:glycine N-acyltransferase-like protein 3 isoform X2 n=1 Tax=Clarias gariepinus TaxID=13013 RepID=UPI00234D0F51|nr:glycine N-acyltransferase-like protein 3 isoform X2 [Clarias gariepinus]